MAEIKAPLPWTVSGHQDARKNPTQRSKNELRPTHYQLSCGYSLVFIGISRSLGVPAPPVKTGGEIVEPRCCSSFPELGQAAILPRNKGYSKYTEIPFIRHKRRTSHHTFVLIEVYTHHQSNREVFSASNNENVCLAAI